MRMNGLKAETCGICYDFATCCVLCVASHCQKPMVRCLVGNTRAPSFLRVFIAAGSSGAALRGEKVSRVHLDEIHLTCLSCPLHSCNPALSISSVLLGVDAVVQCRRSSAPPRLAKRRRLRLLRVVVLQPHQHRLRNLRPNPPTSRPPHPSLLLQHRNQRPLRSRPH